MFSVKGVRPYIGPAISFIYTRVTKSTVEDKLKLKRVLQLLKHTINNKRVMGADNIIQLYTCIYATYVLHPDIKSHTGGSM